MLFKIKHLKNLLVRFFTRDSYYVCEECHKIHKRDGRETIETSIGLKYKSLWYGSVCRECYDAQYKRIHEVFSRNIFSRND